MNRFSATGVAAGALHEGHMQHLDEGTIHAWLDGALPDDEAASVAKHVDECQDCAALVAEARGMIVAAGNIVAALDNVRGGVIPAASSSSSSSSSSSAPRAAEHSLWRRLRFTPTRAALAATLLIAVGSVLTVRSAKDNQRVGTTSNGSSATAQSVPTPSTPAVSVQAQAAVSEEKKAVSAATPARVAAPTNALPPVQRREALQRAEKPSSNVADARQATDSTRSIATDRLASPATPAASANAPVVAGNAAASAKVSGDSVRSAAAQQRLVEVTQPQAIVATGSIRAMRSLAAAPAEECYQVRVDSASSAMASGILPRFALERNSITTQNVIRSVTPEGRVDSIVPGGSWERLTPKIVRVRFASPQEGPAFTLQLDAGHLAGRAGTGDRETNVPVTRIQCRR
jgi:hypothetical protein